jgi:hypothetical protein
VVLLGLSALLRLLQAVGLLLGLCLLFSPPPLFEPLLLQSDELARALLNLQHHVAESVLVLESDSLLVSLLDLRLHHDPPRSEVAPEHRVAVLEDGAVVVPHALYHHLPAEGDQSSA